MSISQERSSSPPPVRGCLLLACLVVLVLAGVLAWQLGTQGRRPGAPAQAEAVSDRTDLAPVEQMNIDIYQLVAPSVVQVMNLANRGKFFGLDVQQVPKGVGSGFVWDEEGHVVTNYHVVEGADTADVHLMDGSHYEARHVFSYPDKDIAVLYVNAPKRKLRPILIGASSDLKVGQEAFAIGDPFAVGQTMTKGIVSALDREIEAAHGRPIRGLIQTSAPINPGNSGGPLLDSAGRLIGMNTAILSPSGTFAGIGFAIPVDEVNQIVTDLIRHGSVARPMLGVQIFSDQAARQLGVEQGVLNAMVVANGPAAQAGLQGTRRDQSGKIELGDAIVALDGKPITNTADLSKALDGHKVGDTVTLTVTRDGERRDVQVTLRAEKE